MGGDDVSVRRESSSPSEKVTAPLVSSRVVGDGGGRPLVDLSLRTVWRNTRQHVHASPSLQMQSGGGRIALCALFLGCVFGVGSQWILFSPALRQAGLYLVVMAIFHTIEFVWTATFHPSQTSATAFLLNHSREYHTALAAGVLEYAVESFLFPSLKYPACSWLMYLGLALTVAGQLVRTLAMFTAAANFTHIVAETREPNHQLVTHGIYSVCRHPSYAGWFWWSVGTQVLLGNPVCTIAYAAVSFLFFRNRIEFEEAALIDFFGDAYLQYQTRAPSGVPFVEGFRR